MVVWSCFAALFLSITCHLPVVLGDTYGEDAAALIALKNDLQNTPASWEKYDPCGAPWDGITCNNGRVVTLTLASMNLKGTVASDIGSLTQLQFLDLSNNPGISGQIPQNIGNLLNLTRLMLLTCSFTGPIPLTIGNLAQLVYLDLNSNKLTGNIPASLGRLSNLYWLDISNNTLTGTLPVSKGNSPGLDNLLKAKHFHFNKNKLSGSIPVELFSSSMVLIHILFDDNQFTGQIPSTVCLVKSLEVLRLDRNSLNGSVPSNLNNLTGIIELNLAGNKLTGTLPNLTGVTTLNYLDLSNNSFDPSPIPSWLTTMQSLTTLVMEGGVLQGPIPRSLFSLPSLEILKLKNNRINGTLSLDNDTNRQLLLVDFESNQISSVTVGLVTSYTLILYGNPICVSDLANTRYCQLPTQVSDSYSTNLTSCGNITCPQGQKLSPQSCECSYPFEGLLIFRAPAFQDISNSSRFTGLEYQLWTNLSLAPHSVYLSNLYFDVNDYLVAPVDFFPSNGIYLNQSEILRISSYLTNQSFKPPSGFGPYYFVSLPYIQQGASQAKSFSSSAIIGIVVGCSVLVILLFLLGFYALKYRKRAKEAALNPFETWTRVHSKGHGDAPQVKGVRWFSFNDAKKYTNNFFEGNEIGAGGYGKVYKGTLPSGQIVAIKRAQKGSTQGAHEFKTEIELLSRVHHKNLVSLLGFCFDQGEQILIYEFISNGTLGESLSGRTGIWLDWKRRVKIALDSARGLAYLHELADPPIIHRDVKSTNILLDEDLNAKVADFGLSKLIDDEGTGHVSTQVKGTLGYLDPEYYMTQQLTYKSDVYSFGVVMLELVTAKPPIQRGRYVVREVKAAIDKTKEFYGLEEILDPTIRGETSLVSLQKFVGLALQCTEELASKRPSMNEVVKEIEAILQNEQFNERRSASASTNLGIPVQGIHQPYDEQISGKGFSSDEFKYSGAYAFTSHVEPK
ncbi:leucine-rich repeat receptor protein kinase HPCA1-like isoform X2 [Nymphaea colorata]|nr:leucine-rich repeat receptor protein kinase HPCA1-like isoform X2 [Nymphaea colorata]